MIRYEYIYIYIYICNIVLVKYTICIRFLYSVVKDGQSVPVIREVVKNILRREVPQFLNVFSHFILFLCFMHFYAFLCFLRFCTNCTNSLAPFNCFSNLHIHSFWTVTQCGKLGGRVCTPIITSYSSNCTFYKKFVMNMCNIIYK